MYEINPSGGLISQTAKKNYQPKPVNFNLADTTGKPEPGHINVDKIRQQQLDMQKDQLALQYQQYALSVHNAENQPSGGKLICTEFWRMGIMADVIYEADQRFAVLLWDEEPELMRWYLGFAPWFVKHMQGRGLLDRWFTKLVWLIAKPWSEHMAWVMGVLPKDNKFGRFVMWTARKLKKWA